MLSTSIAANRDNNPAADTPSGLQIVRQALPYDLAALSKRADWTQKTAMLHPTKLISAHRSGLRRLGTTFGLIAMDSVICPMLHIPPSQPHTRRHIYIAKLPSYAVRI